MTPFRDELIETRAPRWKFVLARLFGRKIVGADFSISGTTLVTAYAWRERLYLTKARLK